MLSVASDISKRNTKDNISLNSRSRLGFTFYKGTSNNEARYFRGCIASPLFLDDTFPNKSRRKGREISGHRPNNANKTRVWIFAEEGRGRFLSSWRNEKKNVEVALTENADRFVFA